MKLTLPARKNIFKTTWEDSLDLYYTPLIKDVYLHRFELAVSLIKGKQYESLLDIGFGCGIFLKELSLHTKLLYGIDIHENINKVRHTVQKEDFRAELKSGSILSIPYESQKFQCVMAMSILEHLTELDKAMSEIGRIACANADIILGFPVKNLITDSFFRSLGYSPNKIHPSTHQSILKAIRRHFKIVKIIKYPQFFPPNLGLYLVVKCQK